MKKWLNRNVWTLSWVSFLQDAASEMLYPLMPILLTSILHAPAAAVGLIEGLAEGVSATMKLASNRINHFLPRKLMVLLGYGGAALGKLVVAASGTWTMVMAGRLVDRVGKGLRSASRDSLLLHGTDPVNRGKIIGFHRTADTLGAVLGPILALALLALFANDVRQVLWFALIPAALSTSAVLLVKDGQRSQRAEAKLAVKEGRASDAKSAGPLPRRLGVVLGVLVAFGLVNFPDALILLHVSQIGFDVSGVVAAYLLFNISYAALSFPMGWLSDRLAPSAVYAVGLGCFAVTYGGMALTSSHTLTLALLVIYGGFAAANDAVGKSWVSKLAPENMQLRAQSLLQGLSGFGLLVAGLWAGLLWTNGAGMGVLPLLVAGIVAGIVAPLVAMLGRD